ncbi:hypothetical protein BDR04DRAFT_1086532 [Suillus decipiens]|nr:hypothetical protein BDR04DRAFT_1086532 [Suillus decipiens]
MRFLLFIIAVLASSISAMGADMAHATENDCAVCYSDSDCKNCNGSCDTFVGTCTGDGTHT